MIIHGQTQEQYSAVSGIRSSAIKLALKSLRLFDDYNKGLYKQKDEPHFQIGRLAHMMVLEPERFKALVVSHGPINESTGEPYGRATKKFYDWQQANPDVIMVEPWLYKALERMPPWAREIFSSGKTEVSVYNSLPLSGNDKINIKCRPDHLDQRMMNDLKTIRDMDLWEKQIRNMQYWVSHAWYRKVMKIETGRDYGMDFIFMETNCPFRWKKVALDQGYIDYADDKVDQITSQIVNCYTAEYFHNYGGYMGASNAWDDNGKDFEIAQLPAFMDNDDFTITEEGISL